MNIRSLGIHVAGALIVASAALGACSGGGHSSLPGATSGQTGPVASTGAPAQAISSQSGTLSLALSFNNNAPTLAAKAKRSPQYVSGKTKGVYVYGTVPGVTPPINLPPVYADVSSSSPLCTTSGSLRTCLLILQAVPNLTYNIYAVALDQTPTSETAGLGSGFCQAAGLTSFQGANFTTPMSSPAPSCTTGANILSSGSEQMLITAGILNKLSIVLQPVATQFTAVDSTGADNGPNIHPPADLGVHLVAWFMEFGDFAGNLIVGNAACPPSNAAPTTATPFCESFGNPDPPDPVVGSTPVPFAIAVSVPNPDYFPHLCAPVSGTSCGEEQSGTASVTLASSTGILAPLFVYDGTAFADDCNTPPATLGPYPASGCGVPYALPVSNGLSNALIPIGNSNAYNYFADASNTLVIAPFVVGISDCSNTNSCGYSGPVPPGGTVGSTTYPNGSPGYVVNIAVNGTTQVNAYNYNSGGFTSFLTQSGCYATTAGCMAVALPGPTPTPGIGVVSNDCYFAASTPVCSTSTPSPQTNPPTANCLVPAGGTNPPAGTIVATVQLQAFIPGTVVNSSGYGGTADYASYTITGKNAGSCAFQFVTGTTGKYFSPWVVINTTASSASVTVPTPVPIANPIPTPSTGAGFTEIF